MSATIPRMLRVQKSGRLTVVEFCVDPEDINLEKAATEVQAIIHEKRCEELAFDLTHVDYLTSAIVNFFVELLRDVRVLHVYNPSDFNLELLRSLHLDSVIRVFQGWQSELYVENEDADREYGVEMPSTHQGTAEPSSDGQNVQPATNTIGWKDVRDHVVSEIRDFEATLDADHATAIRIGSAETFFLREVTFRGDYVFVFSGELGDGTSVEQIQHVSQVNFSLVAALIEHSSAEGDNSHPEELRPIQFYVKSFPSANAVVHD